MQAFTQPLSFNERHLTNVLTTSLKLCLKWITGQNTSEWTKNHAHKHTIKYRRDTDVRVSHVPPLPSIYKVERRGWRRRENSNGFKFFLGHLKRKLKRTDANTNKQKQKHPLGFHHTWHCILHPLWSKVVGACDDATASQHVHHAAGATSQSLQKSANWCLCFFFFKPTHDSSARPRVNQTMNSLSERTRSKQSARSCDLTSTWKGFSMPHTLSTRTGTPTASTQEWRHN